MTRRCYCGARDVTVPCVDVSAAQRAAADAPSHGSAGASLFTCGGRCRRAMPGCEHLCAAACHAGPCGAAGAGCGPCTKEVTLRCACGARREVVPCHEAQSARAAAGRGRAAIAGAAAPTAVLPCDTGGQCPPAPASVPAAGASSDSLEPAAPQKRGVADDEDAAHHAAAAALRRRHKEERALLAAAKAAADAAERERAAAARAARARYAVYGAGGCVFSVVVALLVLGALSS